MELTQLYPNIARKQRPSRAEAIAKQDLQIGNLYYNLRNLI